ncbi:MAG: helix-turn-helix domain-containing protein [Bifidobacterium mongoliense]|uniref:helix-turn-helix domain-containing protein n=1 Tax=Bifidobacterium mongoliense TaxID=518643 RepID=UPI0026494B73|nr:helix-turn-helix domain-containing protein [Bifidobacterium mongoliense]MDN6783107.1 helix-turn-helix domain-containing protein [Bifidobacterium mongoliense]
MSFRDNLQYLRAQRSMTQEQLAMLLGVSRQSISKWESEKAYPEMDKLLMICDMFGCTLDDLVLGDVRHPAAATVASDTGATGAAVAAVSGAVAGQDAASRNAFVVGDAAGTSGSVRQAGLRGTAPMGVSMAQDVTGYDDHARSFAWHIAAGVSSILVGVGLGMLFDEDNSLLGANPVNDVLQFVFIALGIVIGLALIIPSSMGHSEFRRRHPYVEDFYTDDDRSRSSRSLAIGVVVGVGLILAGVAQLITSEQMLGIDDGWPVGVLLFCVAVAVFSFIYFGMRHGYMDIAGYNKEIAEEAAEQDEENDFYGKITGSLCGIIMLVATILGLWMLFAGTPGHDGASMVGGVPFWIPWPIGGVLCGVVGIVGNILRTNDQHRRER